MNSLKGTQTEKNLMIAFAGECQARMRYDFFAKQAKKEGLEQIAAIFTETSENERSHAKQFFRMLEGGMVDLSASFPAGVIGTTLENLKAAAEGESEEWRNMYPQFAETAEKEGFIKAAAIFRLIAKIEKEHEDRFKKLYDNLEAGKVFKREGKVVWKCRVCGYLHEGTEPPKICPACNHPTAYFELNCENY